MNMHHIIITGASRGIGHATALLYASMGWNISICSRHCDYQMTQTQDAITAAGGQYFSFCGDMGNAADAEEFLTRQSRPSVLRRSLSTMPVSLILVCCRI
ncbi:SDR family NAD(P)-dependent oxidoreductase [Roseburia sp. AM59-24XD]|nr:SDR family NAD(P)-dependent oxidoreductase [Roseburia sp. AM59-24XD]RHP86309.1 SDR family NAD(P)-dependent oxidoreductase [Roseburia sp. AM59-24XD]